MTGQSSFLFDLRETAKNCPNVLTRKMLRDSSDEIAALVAQVNRHPTLEAFKLLNGAVAKAARTLGLAEQPTPDNSQGGSMPLPERLAA
ncbi:hypothetical protein [Bradyrhizobium ivorense]|uniref:hypothetical protein n=1 Tax=Bradyrhizobium ivorense TaxID=2511166 RepID=UPI0010B63668|nr:hypothetical protein [Bradyrhizobium ivorense]VIO73877.1 hypothetical protein CI41S_39860 [Bradyrhizobium ivorense]